MRAYTDTYNKARQAGAKPIILAEVWTDKGPRIFSKDALTETQINEFAKVFIGTNQVFIGTDAVLLNDQTGAFEWEMRVLAFGDFQQTLSTDSSSVFESIVEKTMDSYTLTLDNADGYFTELAAKEQFNNYPLILKQGFDYPDFEYEDFITLFFGRNTSYGFDYLKFMLTADQSLDTRQQDDPDIDITRTYALRNYGAGYTAAQEIVTYEEIEEIFYTETEYVITYEVLLDSGGFEQDIYSLYNGSDERFTLGVDSSNQVFFRYNRAIPGDPSDTVTYTSSLTLNVDEINNVSFYWNFSAGYMEFTVNGVTERIDLGIKYLYIADTNNHRIMKLVPSNYQFLAKVGSFGTGNTEFAFPRGICALGGHVYVVDAGNNRLVKYDSDLNYVAQIGSAGSGNDNFSSPQQMTTDGEYLYIADTGNGRIVKRRTNLAYVTEGSPPPGYFQSIAIASDNKHIYAVQYNSSDAAYHISKYDRDLNFISSFNTGRTSLTGITTNGQFLWLASYTPKEIERRTMGGLYLIKNSTEVDGIDGGDRSGPYGLGTDYSHIYNAMSFAYRVDKRSLVSMSYVSHFGQGGDTGGTGNDEVNVPEHVSLTTFERYSTYDNGVDDTITIGDNFDGLIRSIIVETFAEEEQEKRQCLWNSENDPTLIYVPDNCGTISVDIVDGVWEEWGYYEEYVTEFIEERVVTAFEYVELINAGIYGNPGNNQQNLILPLPYGDMTENSDVGAWVCPLIDTVNHVYCAAGWPVLSVADGNVVSVYVDGILQSSGYTFDESNDYESQGNIAIITFSSDKGDSVVTVKMKGKEYAAGGLITNPIDIIDDWMDYVTNTIGTATWTKDQTTFGQAQNDATTYGYTCAGVIQANNTLGFWLQSILNSFLGSFRFGPDGALQVFLEPPSPQPNIQEYLDEYEEISVSISEAIENIINRVVINYAISYAEIDRRFKNGGESSYFRTANEAIASSIRQYGERTQTLDFDWTRNTATINTVLGIVLDRYSRPELTLKYTGQDFKWMPLELGDDILATLSLVRDMNNNVVNDVLYRLREKTQNLDDFSTSMILRSIGYRRLLESTPVYIGTDAVYIGVDQVFIGR